MIIEYLTEHVEGKVSDFTELLGVKTTRVKKLIYELIADGIIVAQGGNRNRTYKLKA
jgi:predicted ArsR family transcriptional regulator